MRVEIQSNDLGILITPKKYNRGGRYVGTAIIKDATVSNGVITGELLGEYLDVFPFSESDLPGGIKMRMKSLTDSISRAKVVYASGKEMFYLA